MSDKEVVTRVVMQGDTGGMLSSMNKAKSEFLGITGSMQTAVGGIGAAFNGLGGVVSTVMGVLAGGSMFSSVIDKAKEVGGEVLKLSKAFAISAEEASVLRIALDDTFISVDDMVEAKSRLQKQLVKNEESFEALGVATRDNNNNFRGTIEIMSDVNSKLKEFKEGTDQDIEGIKIYGKGWEDAKKTLKVTAEVINEARERAEKLHLVFGGEGLQQVKAYRMGMKDLDDVAESLKVQIGIQLLPALTKVAVALGDTGVVAANSFKTVLSGVAEAVKAVNDNSDSLVVFASALAAPTVATGVTALATALRGVSLSIASINAAMAANPVGLAALLGGGTYYATKQFDKGLFNSTGLDISGMNRPAQQQAIAQKNLETGNAELAKKLTKLGLSSWKEFEDYQKKGLLVFNETKGEWEKNLRRSTGGPEKEGKDDSMLWASSHDKYLDYLKAFSGKEIGIVKAAANMALEVNRQAYDKGLIDQKTYLETKLQYLEQEGLDEITLKAAEVNRYRDEVTKYQDATDAKGANAYHAALTKVASAEKELIGLQSKLALDRASSSFDAEKAEIDHLTRLHNMEVQLLELAGKYELAAQAKANFEKESADYKRLGADEQDRRDELSRISVKQAEIRDTKAGQSALFINRDMKNATFGPYTQQDQYAVLKTQYDKELADLDSHLNDMAARREQDTIAYEAAVNRRFLIDKKYAADKEKLDNSNWQKGVEVVGNSLSTIGSIMMNGNKDQFEAGKAMAIAAATISMIQGSIQAFTSCLSIPYVGIALGTIAAAAVIAQGTMQIAKIESMQYTPREKGGPVQPGQTYLVGEKRPELLTMGRDPGYITPYVPKGGGSTINVYSVHQISAGVSETVRAEIMRALPAITAHNLQAVERAINSGGSLSSAVGRI